MRDILFNQHIGFIQKLTDCVSCLKISITITTATGESEGLSIVILEAQAMGLPVISSIHPDIPEAIIHEETGFLAQEKDWESLAKYILTLFENMELREKFSTLGRRRIKTEFNLKLNAVKLEEIYDNISIRYDSN